GGERPGELGRDLRILPGRDPRPGVHDRDPAPEAPEHLSELETDVAAAEHEQVRRELGELQDRLVRERPDGLEPWNRRHQRTASDVQEEPLALERRASGRDGARTHATRGLADESEVRALRDLALLAAPEGARDL